MSDGTKIGWTDATLNAQVGCTKISDGCKNCSALRDAQRLSHNPNPKIAAKYEGVVTEDGKNWTGRINFDEKTLLQALRWRRPRRIFVDYTSDIFHTRARVENIDLTFAVMALAKQHTFQVLTKRTPWAFGYLLHAEERVLRVAEAIASLNRKLERGNATPAVTLAAMLRERWPLPNVWLGFSAENQAEFDARWADFRHIAGQGWTVFVSCEPLLGPVVLPADFLALGRRAQVIAGGESGKLARPSHPDWFRGLRDQCVAAGVAFMFKQWGEWEGADGGHPQDGWQTIGFSGRLLPLMPGPESDNEEPRRVVRRVGKKTAGRLLDGKEWSQFPQQERSL